MPRHNKTGQPGLYKMGGRYYIDIRWTDSQTGQRITHRHKLPANTSLEAARSHAINDEEHAIAGRWDGKHASIAIPNRRRSRGEGSVHHHGRLLMASIFYRTMSEKNRAEGYFVKFKDRDGKWKNAAARIFTDEGWRKAKNEQEAQECLDRINACSRKRRGRGEGGIFQRGKVWVAELSLGYGPDGKRKRRTLYGKSKAEVEAKLYQLQEAAMKGPKFAEIEQSSVPRCEHKCFANHCGNAAAFQGTNAARLASMLLRGAYCGNAAAFQGTNGQFRCDLHRQDIPEHERSSLHFPAPAKTRYQLSFAEVAAVAEAAELRRDKLRSEEDTLPGHDPWREREIEHLSSGASKLNAFIEAFINAPMVRLQDDWTGALGMYRPVTVAVAHSETPTSQPSVPLEHGRTSLLDVVESALRNYDRERGLEYVTKLRAELGLSLAPPEDRVRAEAQTVKDINSPVEVLPTDTTKETTCDSQELSPLAMTSR